MIPCIFFPLGIIAYVYEMGNPKSEEAITELRRGDTMSSPKHKDHEASMDLFLGGRGNSLDQTTFDTPSPKKGKFRRKGTNKVYPEEENFGESPEPLKGRKSRSKSRNKRKMKKARTRGESFEEEGNGSGTPQGFDIYGGIYNIYIYT